jgi:hypothetical protein
MLIRTIAATAVLILAVALNAYAPHPGFPGGGHGTDDGNKTDAKRDSDKANTGGLQLKALHDTAIYYAPNEQIGTLKSGARVRLLGTQGNWAKVRFASDRIIVEGWVLKAHVAILTSKDIDTLKGLKNQQDKEREKAKDREQKKNKDHN